MKNAFLLSLLFAPALLAQAPPTTITATVPVAPAVNVDRPFAGGIGRYQQYYSAASLQAQTDIPRRLMQIEFFAGSSSSSTLAQLDAEFILGYAAVPGLGGTFDNNIAAGTAVIVRPRQLIQLSPAGPGGVCMTVPFTVPFAWDRVRGLVLEIRIYGNSLNNQPFIYNCEGVTFGGAQSSRCYQAGSGGLAPNGTVQNGWGMRTRFTARLGTSLPYGTGCPGEANIVPIGSVTGLAWPGVTWTHQLSNAGANRICLWVLGDSKTDIGGAPLPIDIEPIFGFSPTSCLLRNNAIFFDAFVTTGSGPGGGFFTLPVPLPAVTGYIGSSLFSQWVVLDPLAPNGILSTTAGLESIVTVVGG